MKNKNGKRGFTLIELIVTILLLAIIGVVIVYNMTSVSDSSKDTEYERYIAAVKSAAAVYADNNEEAFASLYENKAFIYIIVKDLVEAGLLDETIENPYTGKEIDLNDKIKANLDTTSGALTFEYPLNSDYKETFLSSISDYVVWGEEYDCMTGSGSYQLALSDEDGNLIDMSDPANVEKYAFNCTMPSDFKATEAGSYDIEYTWLSESGTKKNATRTLRVLEKATPTFLTFQGTTIAKSPGTNYAAIDYDGALTQLSDGSFSKDTKAVYTPSYDGTEWKYLALKPYVEGTSNDTVISVYSISRSSGTQKDIIANQTIDDSKYYPVDDGNKDYYIATTVYGHYNKSYSYSATGAFNVVQQLVLPDVLITNGSATWTSSKEYTVAPTYSPVGIQKYEYILSNETSSTKISENDTNIKTLVDSSGNYSNKGIISLLTKVISNQQSCSTYNSQDFKYVYFRAVNNEGYTGSWSKYKTANLTSDLNTILDSDVCTSGSNCCIGDKNNCHYESKSKYISINGQKFVFLEKSGDNILVTYDGTYSSMSPLNITLNKWEINICDGTFSTDYFNLYSPMITAFYSSYTKFGGNSISCKNSYDGTKTFSGHTGNAYLYSCQYTDGVSYNSPAVEFYKNMLGEFKSKAIMSYWRWYSGLQTSLTSNYTGYSYYVGSPSWIDVNKYKSALYGGTYWITNTYATSLTLYVSHPGTHCGENTTKNTSYLYGASNGSYLRYYANNSLPIKPMIWFKDLHIISGDGSLANPYVTCL